MVALPATGPSLMDRAVHPSLSGARGPGQQGAKLAFSNGFPESTVHKPPSGPAIDDGRCSNCTHPAGVEMFALGGWRG